MNDERLQNECNSAIPVEMKRICFTLNVEDTHKHKYEIDTGNFRFPKAESSKKHSCFFFIKNAILQRLSNLAQYLVFACKQ